jgi:DNA polymerase III delta prime subunit
MPKDFSFLSDLILHIIKNRYIYNKHFIIIKHIDQLYEHFFSFRILLERFTDNAYFLCTTHCISKIEPPIKSRFNCIRIPLFDHDEIIYIFNKYLKINVNKHLLKENTRDFIKAIFLAEVERNEPHLLTYDYCTYRFPLIYNFMVNFSKTNTNLEDIRQFSYKCCQFNISIKEITLDILKHIPNKKKSEFIKKAAEIEHLLSITNKGREPIYIETLLCQLLSL